MNLFVSKPHPRTAVRTNTFFNCFGKALKLALLLAICFSAELLNAQGTPGANIQSKQRIIFENRWKPHRYIIKQGDRTVSGELLEPWGCWQWQYEMTEDYKYFLFRQGWNYINTNIPGSAMPYMGGIPAPLACNVLTPTLPSCHWKLEEVQGMPDYYIIRSRENPNQVLHIESGQLECSEVPIGFFSSHWRMKFITID